MFAPNVGVCLGSDLFVVAEDHVFFFFQPRPLRGRRLRPNDECFRLQAISRLMGRFLAESIAYDHTALSGISSLKEEAPAVHVVLLDVRSDESVKAAAQYVSDTLSDGQFLWAIVNNAGVTHRGLDAWLNVAEYKEVADINLFGIIRVTHAFLPMLKQSKGRIIAISSVCGRSAPTAAAAYCITKYGTEAYMDSIRRELRPYGIRCSILEPGSFKTGIITAENIKQRIERHWTNLSDELKEEYGEKYKDQLIRDLYEKWATTATDNLDDVVGSYYHALTARWPRNRYRCGWDTTLIRIPMTFLPTELEDLCMRLLLGSNNVPAILEKEKQKKN
ncbi:Protein DHS-20 [Aphelenchoides avenae]|nr:Protein DHS-20 [Aphelenchus avenae]